MHKTECPDDPDLIVQVSVMILVVFKAAFSNLVIGEVVTIQHILKKQISKIYYGGNNL